MDMIKKIQTIIPPDPDVGPNCLTLQDYYAGYFSIKSAYSTKVHHNRDILLDY